MSPANLEFVDNAHPHSWTLVAESLYEQAVELYKRRENGYLHFRNYVNGTSSSVPLTNRATFLLGGFALENALKAFLVYENPSWISNGKLSGKLTTHSLTILAERSTLVPYKRNGHPILRSFEDGLESWARYPCGLNATDESSEMILDEKLWKGFLRVTAAYGRKLKVLLRQPWKGPHGYIGGKYEITGRLFGA